MSYLLENSLIVNKKEFNENEEDYLSYEKYELDDYYILTQNDKPFFSIYDIADYCKKKYKDDKLYLIAHRYYDTLKEDNITEFYIFNTINIFEESLTSFITISTDELNSKQHILQNNIDIAKKLLNYNDLHIILGDNTKEHEIVEYISQLQHNINIDLYDEGCLENSTVVSSNSIIQSKIITTRISKILNSIRFIEPRGQKIKKYFILFIIVFLTIFSSKDLTDSIFEQKIADTKRSIRDIKKELGYVQREVDFEVKHNDNLIKNIKLLNKKQIFKSEK